MFYRYACLAAFLALPLGCAEPTDALERLDGVDAPRAIDSIRSALDACGESVPDTRRVDGVPAYAQCPAIEKGAIYSNNGIDTSATKVGADWVRTQFSGGYQCTELAHRYLHFKWKVSWIPNGNAGEWCNTPPPATSGVVQSTTPVHGDLIVFAQGSCGADATYGHVAVVDVVDAAKGKVIAVEQNGARRGTYNTTCAKCFLHVVANDGTNPGETIGAGAVPPGDAGNKPVVVADAAVPVTPRPARDAAVDSARPVPKDDEPEDEDRASAETGKKADAGVRKDAGSKSDEEQVSDQDEDEQDADESDPGPVREVATAEGCSASPGAHGRSSAWALLVSLLVVAARRTHRTQRRARARR